MGWNSYDTFGDSVTEEEILANATIMRDRLLSHGWTYVVVDFRWYDPGANSGVRDDRVGARLAADPFGRLVPAPNRFPSAKNDAGFKPLADLVHAMGLKFGIHIMRGIPRQAVVDNLPIEGSRFRARDAADTTSTCSWCPDMFGVAANPAGQAWYDSLFRQYAAWGVDYIKVDDLSQPYVAHEVEFVRHAIDACGRQIVFSLSPGESPVNQAAHLSRHANLWRMSADLWDRWKDVDHTFDLLRAWQGHGGPGHWPDADMIPLGRIGIRCHDAGGDHICRLTKDEQVTLMSLWCLAPSPLMLGMNLPDNDAWTTSLITNDELIAINQDRAGKQAKPISAARGAEVWAKPLADGSAAVGLFNRSDKPTEVAVDWAELSLVGPQRVRDVWRHHDLGELAEGFKTTVPAHGAVVLTVGRSQ